MYNLFYPNTLLAALASISVSIASAEDVDMRSGEATSPSVNAWIILLPATGILLVGLFAVFCICRYTCRFLSYCTKFCETNQRDVEKAIKIPMPSHTHINEVMLELTPKMNALKIGTTVPTAPALPLVAMTNNSTDTEEDNLKKPVERERLLPSDGGEAADMHTMSTNTDFNYMEQVINKQSNKSKLLDRSDCKASHRHGSVSSNRSRQDTGDTSRHGSVTSRKQHHSHKHAPRDVKRSSGLSHLRSSQIFVLDDEDGVTGLSTNNCISEITIPHITVGEHV